MIEYRTITDGLRFPEGPIAMPDGSIILVEIEAGRLTRVLPDGAKEVVAEPGGGPNGAAMGPDGACYVCNNGGFNWAYDEEPGSIRPVGQADDYVTGRIERIDIETGKIETLYDNCNGNRLSGPNDIVFDRKGNMWFTDLGKARARDLDRGAIYWAKPDGSEIREVIQPFTTPNGIGLSPDEKTLYVAETEGGRLFAYDIVSNGEVELLPYPKSLNGGRYITSDTGMRRFDSLAVEDCGNVCVATLFTGGITVASPDGGTAEFVETGDGYTTNICFGGENLQKAYITLSWQGLLVECDWPRPGLALNFLNK
ncbi:MAG: SMP-30/gluconolactonase/LRE family protein [Pseudomonadota bacterium]|nr:SMP-30/gluconolactonase/LRE family protein [Pseudomonadota bacterium]MEC8165639.1 SMP-30/gluconolactonase/LRE family protein [Pseudomonadota bacterium]MEC8371381.1 SMP-30/gluconolactonase/LRE family protein [Pseudomonadota bacterium]MEC8774896.1 SMP-30/gluconolactonase/LRE family protein [Pseudomonadota bacterium]MED5360536.1 SMP-30/gluconolactonase/LRE family protein [Pseudomonadota bacterium]